MGHRPRLRPSVRIEKAELSTGVLALRLNDPPAGMKVLVDTALAPVIGLLDGDHDVDEILASGPPEMTSCFLLSLAFCALLDGIDDASRAALVEARATGPSLALDMPFQLVVGSRFECGGCGACCRGYSAGPITTEEVKRISGAPFVREDPELRAKPLFVLRGIEDGRGGVSPTYLLNRREDGSCIFLMADNRCRIHAELGAEAKPDVCKLFPWAVTPTPRGIVVSDRTECSTFSRSSTEGLPLEQRFGDVRALFRRKAYTAHGLLSPTTVLPGPIAIGWARFRSVVERCVEVLQREEGPDVFARVEACRDAIALFTKLVGEARPEPGEPERVQAAFEAIPAEALIAPGGAARAGLAPDPETFDGALLRILGRLLQHADRFVHQWDQKSAGGLDPFDAVLPLDLALVFHEGLEVLARRKPASARLDLGDATVASALRRGVLQRVHGLEMEGESRATAGFARTAVTLLAIVAAARARATARGAAVVAAPDLDKAQVAVVRGMTAPAMRDAFHREDPADLDAIFANATRLLERANG
jgi:Fe-S-cluster containining protein